MSPKVLHFIFTFREGRFPEVSKASSLMEWARRRKGYFSAYLMTLVFVSQMMFCKSSQM